MDAAETFRLLLCVPCRQPVRLCRQCDLGQRFWSPRGAALYGAGTALTRLSPVVLLWLCSTLQFACGPRARRPAAVRAAGSRSVLAASDVREARVPSAAATQRRNCEVEGASVEQELWQMRIAMDAIGSLQIAFDHSRSALPDCPQSEPMWYAIARAAELGVVEFPIEVPGRALPTALDAGRAAAAQCPGSVRVWTVLARLEGTESAARSALALDASYAPAALALAAALVAGSKAEEALATLDAPTVRALPGANTIRSQALLLLGKASAAARFAQLELRDGRDSPAEPTPWQFGRREAEEALGRALYAENRASEAMPHLEAAVDRGSRTAKHLLDEILRNRRGGR